jgi:hypothetical protein
MNLNSCDYTIVHKDTIAGLIGAVRELIKSGYRPVGGLCTATDENGNPMLLQAMIRPDSQG